MLWPLPDGVLDLDAGEVRRGGSTVVLTPQETRLLRYLAAREGGFVPVDELLVNVLDYHPKARTRAVYFAVRKLRERLEPEPAAPRVLVGTERRGFALRGAPSAPPTPDAARALVAELAPALPASQVDRLVAATGGIPWVLAAAARHARALPVAAVIELLARDPAALPPLAAEVDRLLAALDPPARELLARLAAVGAPVPTAFALELGPPAALAALGEAALVAIGEDHVAPWPWVVARLREERDAHLEGVARAWLLRPRPPDDAVLTALAGGLAAAGSPLAPALAVELLRGARMRGVTDAHRAIARALAADPQVAWWATVTLDLPELAPDEGLARAEAATRRFAAHAEGDALAEAWSFLAGLRRERGDLTGAEAALDEARRHATVPGRIDVELAHLARTRGDLAGAARAAERAAGALRGDPWHPRALGALATVRVDQGLAEEAVALAERVVAALGDEAPGRTRAAARFRRLTALRAAGHLEEARAALAELEALVEALGDPSTATLVAMNGVLVALDADRPAEARERCLALLAACPPGSEYAASLRVLQELATLRATGRSADIPVDGFVAALLPSLPVPDRLELSAWHAEIRARRGERAAAEVEVARLERELGALGYGPRSPVARAVAAARAALSPRAGS